MVSETRSSCAEVLRHALRLGEEGGDEICEGFVDFEHALPTHNEREVYDLTVALLLQVRYKWITVVIQYCTRII